MNAVNEMKRFTDDFKSLIDKALRSGVPVQHIIFELSQSEFKLRNLVLQVEAHEAAKAAQHSILPANGVHLPPSRQ